MNTRKMNVTIYREFTSKTRVMFESEIDRYVVNDTGFTDLIHDGTVILSVEWFPTMEHLMFRGELAWLSIDMGDDFWEER